MSKSDAVAVVSGRKPDCSQEEIRRAWQRLVDNGDVWTLPRWYGDMATELISRGDIHR